MTYFHSRNTDHARTDVPALATFTVAQRAARCATVKVDTIIVDHSVKVWGLTHALTDTAPTDLTVATHSPLGDQPQSDRILRLPCGRLAPAAPYTFALDALKRACRSSSLQASRSARSALSGCRRRW
eukprot:scaffold77266_cov70-Phaeocystis_antarctica.AAC.3